MTQQATTRWKVMKWNGADCTEQEDDIVTEYPLTIRLDGEEFATMVCTPTDLEELVIGFLASEGIIRVIEDIASISIDTDRGFANVELRIKQSLQKDFYSKRFIGSCCGKGRQFYFQNDVKTAKTVMSRDKVTVEQCLSLMEQLHSQSPDFLKTGGVHNAALCIPDEMIVSRTDIGRHNALDKLYGFCILHRIPVRGKLIAFSGRISSEVLLKTAKIGIGVLLSKSAPTDLALNLAEELGITAVGFIRGERMNVYTHPERIYRMPGNL